MMISLYIQYQWQIEGKDIAGATQREYTIRPEDSGKALSVRVEFPDGSKVTETAESKPTLPIDSLTHNAAPTDIRADSPLLVDEGKAGARAGRVRTVDGDRGDDHVYTVSDPRFEIDAYGRLKLKSGETLDYGKEQSIDLTITATDRAGNELSKPFSVAVKDNPNIGTPPAPNPPEGGKLGVYVPKPGETFSYRINDERFEIAADPLKLKNGVSIDDANEKSVSLAIEITDSGGAGFVRELNLTVAEYGTDGKDTFVVDGDGVKTIVGFNVSHGDLLQLESAAFTALEKGALAPDAFVKGKGATATGAEHRILYDTESGTLAYDPDGNGSAAATTIARLNPNLELEAQHIQII